MTLKQSFRTWYGICQFNIFIIIRIDNLSRHSEPTTAPRFKRVHSNSNRKNTFSDYEFSIFTPVLNFFHAHRISAKELRSKSLNLFAIRHECRTEIRSARLAEESHVSLVRDISLSLNMTEILVITIRNLSMLVIL